MKGLHMLASARVIVRAAWMMCGFSALLSPFARGQAVERDAVTVAVKFQAKYLPAAAASSSSFHVTLNSAGAELSGYDSSEGWHETDSVSVELKPGQDYQYSATSRSNVDTLIVQVDAPSGYRVFVDDVRKTRVTVDGTFKVRVEAEQMVPMGQPSSMRPGRVVWTVGLGNLSNGRPAGEISLRSMDLSEAAYQPGALVYDNASPEVERILYSSALRQIYTPNGLVDITTDNSYKFRIKFYPRGSGQIGAKSGGVYTLSGDPLYEYVVENPNGAPPWYFFDLKITKITRQGGVTRQMFTEMQRYWTGSSFLHKIWDWGSITGTGFIKAQVDGSSFTTKYFDATPWFIARQESRSYHTYSWGTELSVMSDGTATTTFDYTDGVMTSSSTTGGTWNTSTMYSDFDRKGQPSQVQKPLADLTQVTNLDYEADWTGRMILPKSSETTVGTTVTAKSETAYTAETLTDSSRSHSPSSNATMPLVVATRKDYYDSTHYLTTVTKTYREDSDPAYRFLPGMPFSVKKPDGTMAMNFYYRGTFSTTSRTFSVSTSGTDVLQLVLNGTGDSTGAASISTFPLDGQTFGSLPQSFPSGHVFYVVPNISRAQATVLAADGLPLAKIDYICTGTTSSIAWQIVQRDVNHYSSLGFLDRTSRDSGAASTTWDIVTNNWLGGLLDYTIDESGIRTDFTYDYGFRVKTKTRQGATSGSATIPALTTTFEYDAAGAVTKETVSASGTTETIVTRRTFDLGGRILSEVTPGYDTAGSSTASAVTKWINYTVPSSGNSVVTTTLPSGSTRIEEKFRDGRMKSATGTGVVAEYYSYSVETDGRIKTTVASATSNDTRKKETWTDLLGRPVKTSRPGFSGTSQPASEETSTYDDYTGGNTGRLLQATKTGFGPTRFQYNSMSRVTRTGLDADATAGLQTNSAGDRIADTSETFEYYDSAWWATKVESNYPFASSSTAKETSRTRKRLTGLTATLRAETRTYDAEGNETRATTTIDASNKLVTTTTTRPGMASDQVDKTLNGLPIESTGHDSFTVKKRYDPLCRLAGEIEPRTGSETNYSTKYFYHTNTAWVKEVKDAANKRLSFSHYDAASRVVYTEDALGKTTRTLYTARDEIDKVWGTATYPVSYVYNSYGERTNLRTYRDPNNAAATDTTSFPSVGSYDETTWEFDAPSGLLKKKTDAKGKFVEYTYNARGQTYERFWSRTLPNSSTRVKATFTYYGDTTGDITTGELKSITYNDGTPTVSYTYTRSAQTDTVTDAAGTHDFVYDSSKPWQLATEALDSFYGSRALSRTYESATSTSAGTLASHTLATVQGRTSGLKLGTTSAPASELEFSYPISNTGRVAGVTSARGSGSASRTFTYGYETNSALLKSLALTGSHPFTITREFEASRDLITSVEAKWSTTSRTKYAYAYDDRRQRQSVVQSGDVFNDYGGSDNGAIHQIFTYNARGELTAAGTFLGAMATDQTNPLSARKHEFDYDGIGNRKWSNTSGSSTLRDDYTVNELNQYTLKENNTLAVGGTVADDANIQVAAGATATQLAGRHGRHWGDNTTVENWVGPYMGDLTIYAVNSTTGKKMTETRTAFLPPAAQVMTYDTDGNIINDGVWTYEWDAENRLIAMQTTANAIVGGVSAQRLEFKYDYLHRRVEKLTRGGWNGSVYTTVTAQKRFLYDGWSLIAEYSVSGSTLSLVRSYTWGLDIAKSLTDAGGVGALLQIHDYSGSGKDYLPSYDGNGNIAALFDADSSSSATACVAAYEYSPYGESLRCEGTYAKENPIRFSTKFTDDETGLVYYGRRYYCPSQGRFLGRDTKQEGGGLNLYSFCRNNSINLWDYLGMVPNSGPMVPLAPFIVTASRVKDNGMDDSIPSVQYADAPGGDGGGGGGKFNPFTYTGPMLFRGAVVKDSSGRDLVVTESAGTDANGNPVWNAVPKQQFLLAANQALLQAAIANANASMADLKISWSQIAINAGAGVVIGVAGGALTVVTGGVGGAILLGAAIPSLIQGADMNGNPQNYTQQNVLDWWAASTGATLGGAAFGGSSSIDPAHIGGGRDCIAYTADYLAANLGGSQESIVALRNYLNAGHNVSTPNEASALITEYTGLQHGESVSWGHASPGKYAVFYDSHVVYGEVNQLGSFTYDFQLGTFGTGTSVVPSDAIAVPFFKPNP